MADGVKAVNTNYFDGMSKLGRAQKHFLMIATGAYFFDQLDLNVFGMVASSVQAHWGLTMDQLARVNSLSFWGMFFGGILGGWFADKFGRKNSLLTFIAIFSVSSLISGWAPQLLLFEISRFTTGFGVIGMVVIAMVYVAEMMPSQTRGKYQAITIAFGTIGVPLGAFIASSLIPLGPEAWRYVFYIGGGGIVLLPFGLMWLKESPRWLITQGRLAQAEEIVSACTGEKADLSAQLAACAASTEKQVSIIETFKIICGKNYRKRSFAVFMLVSGATVGNFYLANWFPLLFQEYVGLTLSAAMAVVAVGAIGTPIGDYLCSFVSDKGGRKVPIIAYCMILGILTILIGLARSQSMLMITMLITALFRSGCMTMLWTYLAESFPTHIRSCATGIMFSVARAFTALSMSSVPFILQNYGYMPLFVTNAMLFIIPAIIAIFLGEKTGQKTLEELNQDC